MPALSPGDKVTHDAYGLGTVVSVQGSGDDPEAKIDFGGEYGIKHLVLRYAPIEEAAATRRGGYPAPRPPRAAAVHRAPFGCPAL